MTVEARSVVVRLSMDTAQAILASRQFGAEMGRAMDQAEKGTKRADASLDALATKATRVGTVAAAGLALMGKAAVDWESQFASVAKTVDGTASQMSRLDGELRGLARTMPTTHAEIAGVASAAGALGVATPNVAEFTETMIMLGTAVDDLTAEEAATQIAQISNVMQTAASDTDNFASTLVELGNKGASTEGQILALAARVAGVGTIIGATEQEVLALSAAMANLGIPAELGGGAVQRILTKMNTAVISGKDAVEQYAEVAGVSAEKFARVWSRSPVKAFDLLIKGLGRVRSSGGDVASVLEDMGIKGTQNLQVMLRLAGAGDSLTKALGLAKKEWKENTALTDEFGTRAETTGSQVQMAWNRVKDAGIEAGAALLPVVRTAADLVGTLADAYAALPEPVQQLVVGTTALVAVSGLGFAAFVKLRGAIASTRAEIAALNGRAGSSGGLAALRANLQAARADVATLASTWATAGARTQREQERMQLAARSLRENAASAAGQAARIAAPMAGLALASTDVADKTGMANTASLALMGTIAGPWGAAIGGGIGLMKDMAAANNEADDALAAFNKTARETGDLRVLRQGLKEADAEIEAFRKKVDPRNATIPGLVRDPGAALGATKNWVEGLFGDSDVVEMEKKRAATVSFYQELRGAGELLAAGPSNNWKPSIDEMTAALAEALPVAQDLFPEIVSGFDDLTKLDMRQIGELEDALFAVKAPSAEAADGLKKLGLSAEDAQSKLDKYEDRLKAARGASRDAAGSFLDMSASIDDSKVSLNSWMTELEKQQQALRDYRKNLAKAIDLGLSKEGLAELLAQGEDGAMRVEQMVEQGASAIERFNKIIGDDRDLTRGFGRQFSNELVEKTDLLKAIISAMDGDLEALNAIVVDPDLDPAQIEVDLLRELVGDLNDKLDETDRKRPEPKVDSGSILEVAEQAATLLRLLDLITRDRTVNIGVKIAMNPLAAFLNPGMVMGHSEGGTIRRYDLGGTVVGKRYPYADKILAAVAPGEEVISNRHGQADRNRAELKAANAGAKLTVLSAGAAASRQEIASYASLARSAGPGMGIAPSGSIGMDGLLSEIRALARAAADGAGQRGQLYGDVHISGDPAEFKRQMAADRRAAELGGWA